MFSHSMELTCQTREVSDIQDSQINIPLLLPSEEMFLIEQLKLK